MVWQQSSLHFATLTLTLTLELLSFTPPPTQAQTQTTSSVNPWALGETSAYDPPPDIGSPTRTESGSTRNPQTCSKREQSPNPALTALTPKNTNLGLTVEERPTFFAYIPRTSAKTAKFVLQDQDDKDEKDIYRTTFPIPDVPGIVSFKLPDNAPSLAPNKTYRWTIAIVCPPKIDGSEDELGIYAKIWRTQLLEPFANELQKATPRDRVKLYRQYKIWHEALATLAALRLSNPNDSQLATEWKELLESAGQGEFAQAPILNQ